MNNIVKISLDDLNEIMSKVKNKKIEKPFSNLKVDIKKHSFFYVFNYNEEEKTLYVKIIEKQSRVGAMFKYSFSIEWCRNSNEDIIKLFDEQDCYNLILMLVSLNKSITLCADSWSVEQVVEEDSPETKLWKAIWGKPLTHNVYRYEKDN